MDALLKRFIPLRPYQRENSPVKGFQLDAAGLTYLEGHLESDRGRIINSAAVRRLQQKTQVFPLERNAAVRSRLTHSLEVQQTGRFITRSVFRLLREQGAAPELLALERVSESLVEMACLLHDIGNPPFGHFGEAALSRWFSEHLHQLPAFSRVLDDPQQSALRDNLRRELESFEGNAQAIRLMVSLQQLNLTYLQSACVLKYTRCATDPRPAADAAGALNYLQKKPGYYFSESRFIQELQQALQLQPGHRFALTYLMEAADDIAYCLADIEDSVDKGILTHPQLAELLKAEFAEQFPQDPDGLHFNDQSFAGLVDAALQRAKQEPINKDHAFFVWLRVGLIHPLVQHAAGAFVTHLPEVTAGNLNRALLEDASACHAAVKTLKQIGFKHVFNVPEVSTLMLQGYRILTGLLDIYLPLLQLPLADFRKLEQGDGWHAYLLESRLFQRLPGKHLKAYQQLRDSAAQLGAGVLPDDVWEAYCRCRLLQDMISGMTDQFALEEYQTLAAIQS
ncbi:dGTPase [Marinospirillum alkaliphilum]|uniref:dGTPase n=1 Tax=Marinospirillum alkaliphilum DSM 21637 TaxID=1122209 RepID=A0A1K1ZWV4_9GAMM|nr:dGTPase [Marinospirillum alkaliphilum]SFX78670.1 dGTPase [Marinospirillum alkaliphilum DSM 21637]